MIREEPFEAVMVESIRCSRASMILKAAPSLLGYVRTIRKATAQAAADHDTGDPLLAHWRYGLGKVTAFSSDAKSRWASLRISRWPGYSRFWSQVLRENLLAHRQRSIAWTCARPCKARMP